MLLRVKLVIVFLIVIDTILYSQTDIQFVNYTQDDGLSQNSIYTILQDFRGFMWFGTQNGLNKYDGVSFKTYYNIPGDTTSLRNNIITWLLEDTKNNLWIGTMGGGLHLYNREKDNFKNYDLNLEKNVIRCILEDSNQNLWLGTNSGLVLFKHEAEGFIKYSYNPDNHFGISGNYINAIVEDKFGAIWLAVRNRGLEKFDIRTQTFKNIDEKSSNKDSLNLTDINTLYSDGENTIWIGTVNNGLIRLNTITNEFTSIPFSITEYSSEKLNHYNVSKIIADNKNALWIGTMGGGISYYDLSENKFKHYLHHKSLKTSLAKNAINTLFTDSNGNLWVGTESGGINFYDKSRKKFHLITHIPEEKNSLNTSSVLCIEEDNNENIWFGLDEGGISRYSIKKGQFNHYIPGDKSTSLAHHVVVDVFEDSKNNIWLAPAGRGLDLFNSSNNTFQNFKNVKYPDPTNSVRAIYEDSDNHMWVGTNGNGLALFDRDTKKYVKYYVNDPKDENTISNNDVTDIVEDSIGNIWIGTWGGLNKFDKVKEKFIRYTQDYSSSTCISNNEITCLFIDSKRNLWIGTYGGLNKYVKELDGFETFNQNINLPNNVICAIEEDEAGNLWISTYKGLSKFNPETKKVTNYDERDGLQDNIFNLRSSHKNKEGLMYFGGINGVTYFFPDSIKESQIQSQITLTGFKLFNNPVNVGEEGSPLNKNIWETNYIKLKHNQSSFSFEFVELNFSTSAKKNYKYILENYNQDWIVTQQQEADYTNVLPGKYVFKVTLSNSDKNTDIPVHMIHLEITPPFWQTWWFRFLVVSTIIISAFSLHWIRVINIKKQNEKLEALVNKRTKQLQEEKEKVEEHAVSLKNANVEILHKNIHLGFQKEEIQEHTKQIEKMNKLLQMRYEDLQKNVDEISKARVMQKRVSYEEFCKIYPDDETCIFFIRELKNSTSFECRKCQNKEYTEQTGAFFRRCKKCGYREPVTYGTIFYRLKFPIVKAFYILYLVSMGRELTIDEISQLVSLRRETCWTFKNKVIEVMKTRKRFKNPKEGWKELIVLPIEKNKRVSQIKNNQKK